MTENSFPAFGGASSGCGSGSNNSDLNSLEFEEIGNEAGHNSFFLSAKKEIEATGAASIFYAKVLRFQEV